MPLATTSGEEDRFQNMELRQAVQVMPAKSTTFTSSNATTGAVTLNAAQGHLTSEALTLTAATEYVLTLTNSLITTTDLVFASVANGTNTQSPGPSIASCTPGAGAVTIRVFNESQTNALNGTVKVQFFTVKMTTYASPP